VATVRHRAKVTTDSLYEVIYEKLIDTKMNDLDLCLEVVQGRVNNCVRRQCLQNYLS